MRKIILGILAVFCLQMSFQVYHAIERTREEYVGMSSVADPVKGSVASYEFAELDADITRPVTAAARRPVYRRKADTQVRLRPALTAGRYNPRPVSPEPVDMVAVKSARVYRPASVHTHAAAAITEDVKDDRRGKRSFFAKALPVIKKPYDWLKAVGSKLR